MRFGADALFIALVSVVFGFLTEFLFDLIVYRKKGLYEISFLVTSLSLAVMMPVNMPLYIVAICAVFSQLVVKLSFGGLGKNYFNPSNTGRCLAGMIATLAGVELGSMTVEGEVYTSLTLGGTNSLYNLFTGSAIGGIGTIFILLILICFVVFATLKIIDIKIPVIAVLSYLIVGGFLFDMETLALSIFSGSFLFVSVFVITDPNTSPNTLLGKIVYSVAFGALSALLWSVGTLGENTVFAVALFVNLFVPFMDKYFVLKPFRIGGLRHARKN